MFGTHGQRQFGIDIVGHRRDGTGIEVVSCKCYSVLKSNQIKTFSDDFFKHFDSRWRTEKVHRFVLAVASAVDALKLREAITKEIKRFREVGIEYEVWGPKQLQERLRPYRGIVSQYLGEHSVPLICGPSDPGDIAGSSAKDAVPVQVTRQLLELQQVVAGNVRALVDSAVGRLRRGERKEVERDFETLRADQNQWSALDADVQARVLRLISSCRLQRDDVIGAEEMAAAADRLAPQLDEPRLRASIAFHREGAAKALSVLGEPKSRDGAYLKSSFLLLAGNLEEARKVLDEHPALTTPDAEIFRLKAFIALEENDREKALEEIQSAEAIAPEWHSIQTAGGNIRFAYAVSLAVPPASLRSPNPIDLDLIREDKRARQTLDEADRLFSRRLEGLQEDDSERRSIETWRLAVLACRRDRLAEAEKYAQELLHQDRTHWGAIAWSIARGFPINLSATAERLECLLDLRRGDASHLAALLLLLMIENKTDKASKVLNQHANHFSDRNDLQFIEYWRQRIDERKESISKDTRLSVRGPHALEAARTTGNWSNIPALMEEIAACPETIYLLLPTCQALAQAGQWSLIQPYVDFLENRIATTESLRIAAFSSYNNDNPRKALALIDAYVKVCGSPSTPLDIRRLHAAAKQAIGDVAGALNDFQTLSLETGEPEDILQQAELAFQIGNLELLLATLRNPAARSALKPIRAVQWAGIVGQHDPGLAQSLLARALEVGIPDEALPSAFLQSLHLPDHAIARQIMPEMGRVASDQEGSAIRTVSINDLPQFIEEMHENAHYLRDLYLNGQAAIHFLAARMGHGFARLFLRNGESDSSLSTTAQTPLFIRYGGRPPSVAKPDLASGRICVDITSLLLAQRIGLLDVIVDAGIVLDLPRSIPQTLLFLENESRQSQPDRVNAWRVIGKAVAEKRILIREDQPSLEPTSGGQQVFLVIHASERQDRIIEADGLLTIPIRGVLDALFAGGLVDNIRHAEAIELLGSAEAVTETPTILPQSGDCLLFEFNTVETIAVAGMFEIVAAHFDARIDSHYVSVREKEIAEHEDRLLTAQHLKELRSQVSEQLSSGAWRLLPKQDFREQNDSDADPASPVEWSLRELLAVPALEAAAIWIDDRWISQYPAAEGHPIVGITEVLSGLRDAKFINDDRYFAFLSQLRKGRVHFLPPTAEEALHHLRKASINDFGVIETPGLRVLRQSFADAVLLESHWVIPDINAKPEKWGEMPIAVRLARLFDETLTAIWEVEKIDAITRSTWSDWAWSALRSNRFERIPRGENPASSRFLYIQSLAFLLASGVTISLHKDSRRAKEMLGWITNRILVPAIELEPSIDREIADIVANALPPPPPSDGTTEKLREHRLWQAYLGRYVDLLPEQIRQHLHANRKFVESLGITIHTVIEVAEMSFEAEQFWLAVTKARRGEEVALSPVGGKKQTRLGPGKKGTLRFSGGLRAQFDDDPAFRILDGRVESRRKAVEAHPEWLDFPHDQREAIISEIISAPTPAKRMERLDARRKCSIPYRRHLWRQDLRIQGKSVTFSPPPALDMLRYLRLGEDNGNDPQAAFSKATETLIEEFDVAEAFCRLSALPTSPPVGVVNVICEMSPKDRDQILSKLSDGAKSPMARLQVLSLMGRFGHDRFSADMDRLLDDWPNEAEAFLAILHWTGIAYAHDPDWRRLRGCLRLALVWVYADHVADALLGIGATKTAIFDFFTKKEARQRFEEVLIYDPEYQGAAAYPDLLMNSTLLLFHGLAAVVGQNGKKLLSVEQRQRLEVNFSLHDGERKHPKGELFQDRRALDNKLGTFFSQRPEGIYDRLPEVGWKEVEQNQAEALRKIHSQIDGLDGWALARLTGAGQGKDGISASLLEPLQKLDVHALAISSDEQQYAVLRLAAEIAARTENGEIATRFADGLVAAAKHFAEKFRGPIQPLRLTDGNDPPATKAAIQLLETLAVLSRHTKLDDATAFLSMHLLRFTDAWPQSVPMVRNLMEHIHDGLPFYSSKPFWKAWLKLRAI
ncbi:MAG: hypothetical protein HQL43_06785 [Alphaproteobacteria bacterium]|nr:hypothetical protein [Alphaproteobacteria bacterium]